MPLGGSTCADQPLPCRLSGSRKMGSLRLRSIRVICLKSLSRRVNPSSSQRRISSRKPTDTATLTLASLASELLFQQPQQIQEQERTDRGKDQTVEQTPE